MEITLLDGTIIEGYPKEQPTEKTDNEMRLDTTGKYLTIGNKKPHRKPTREEIVEQHIKESKPFTDNAFLFLSNAKRILSDSRMFLARVHGIESGLAYCGTGGFRCPTLGVYIEWWLTCLEALQHECLQSFRYPQPLPKDDTGQWLVFSLAGSPLSGLNSCGVMDVNGRRRFGCIFGFSSGWHSFMKINKRYDEAKSTCQAYTLQQVLDIFKTEGRTVNPHIIDNVFLSNKIGRLEKNVEYYKRQAEDATEMFHEHLVLSRADEIEQAICELEERQAHLYRTIAQIDERHKELRRRMKAGEITNVEYQKKWHPLHNLRDDTKHIIDRQEDELRQKFFNGRVYVCEMKHVLQNRKQKAIGEIVGCLTSRKEQGK